MIFNISAVSCVLQATNTGPLLFYSLNNTRTETKCPEQTLIMRIPEHKNIWLNIFIKAYQGMTLPNSKKEMIYWFTQGPRLRLDEKQVTFLHWNSSLFQPASDTVISLPGKIYSFEITIWEKEFVKLIYDFSKNVNKLDNKLLDFIWLDEKPTIMSQIDSQSSICKNTSTNFTFSQCLNFSQMANLHKEYYIFSWTTHDHNLIISILKSWDEASSLCESIKGQLPYFTSSDELNEIIKFLRLSSEIPPIEAIFIGLWFDTEKVSALRSLTFFYPY